MSTRDMKKYNNYSEVPFKMENEPEEGEIVDEYDLIVSSDEELSMRQRIRELEAENEEIEQIAVISRSYTDKIDAPHNNLENSRAAQVPTDVSSISSTEFVTPKKRKRRKSREHKRKHHHQHQHQHHQYDYEHNRYDQYQEIPLKARSKKSHCKRRQKLFAKKHQKLHSARYGYKDINIESISLDSLESSDSSTDSLTDTENFSKNSLSLRKKSDEPFDYDKYITRDTLRFAVARNSNETVIPSKRLCLKDKLLKQELVGQSSQANTDETRVYKDHNQNNEIEEDDDDDVQVIENEPEIQTIDEDSTDSMEEKELRLIALKSAVLKKHMQRKMRNAEAAYSPTDFDEMLSSGILKEDNKLDDVDVVDLEAEDSQNACATVSPEASPQLMMLDDQEESQQMVDCKPVDMDIANSDSEDTTVGSWSKDVEPMLPTFPLATHDFTNHFQYGFYMPDLHELPPPPPGVDDYEDAPPPPPYHKLYNFEMQDMDLDNEDNQEHFENTTNTCKEPDLVKDSSLPANVNQQDDNDDEEEKALRALLLSKIQSPKNQKKLKRTIEVNETQDTLHDNEQSANNVPAKPTEFILKEAVKRLKIHSKNESNKDETFDDINRQNTSELQHQLTECSSEENKETLQVIEKLKNRLKSMKTEKLKVDSKENANVEIIMNEKPQERLEDPNIKMTEYNNEHECPSSISPIPEFTNKIDISDITRRLQQIKENVLNSTNRLIPQEPAYKESCERFNVSENVIPQEPAYKDVNEESCERFNISENVISQESAYKSVNEESSERFNVSENVENENRPPLGNIHELNSFESCENSTNACDIEQPPINEKIVEANFDDATKKTTFKVTITNSSATKSSLVTDTKDKKNDISFKENKSNNGVKNLKSKVNTKNKVALNSQRLVKIISKTTEISSAIESEVSANKTSSLVKPIIPTVPTYSLLRTTKIVKPNKVINTNFDLNRRQVISTTETTTTSKTISKNDTTQLAIEKTDNPRLITSIDQVKHMYKVAPIIISVQNSSNESSGDEWGGDYDAVYKPLYDYNDNASPLSLILESPSHTPLRSNSPTNSSTNGSTKNTDLNKKLDDFLKAARTTVTSENAINKTQKTNVTTNEVDKINKTPLAVRHLPAAAQSEYRRLVHRMKLLENKRKSTNPEDNKKDSITDSKRNDSSLAVSEEQSKEKDKADTTNSTLKTSLVKKVLIRNANNNTSTENENQKPATTSKFHKANVLRSYENLYVKFGAGIVNNLEKSLTLVEEAKKAKISKLKLEQRLKELKAEMDILQGKHREEQQKISRIYPSICSTNEVITSLKQKRSKVFKAAINLGKTFKGEDYRLNNDLKESINSKSKQLAMEIKLVNSLKVQDIAKIEETLKSCEKDNKKETEIENIQTKTNKESAENQPITNTLTATLVKEKEVEVTNENPLQSDEGGNTEFQNIEDNNSKNIEENEKFVPTESTTKPVNLKEDTKMDDDKSTSASYISPLEHLRNIDSNVDPNGVICPYDLMGNCEDATCKYVHISTKEKS